MKKLFGLLVIGTVGMFIACTSDDSDSNPYNVSDGGNSAGCPAGTVSMLDAAGNAYCGAAANSSSAPIVTPVGVSSSSAMITPVAVSSSSMQIQPVVVSSSSAPATPVASSSSVVPVAKSSSSKKVVTPVVEEPDEGLFKLGLWDGTAGAGQVPTGNKTGGYWYSYTDTGDKGESTLEWCSEAGSEYGADDLVPVIKENGGLCGKFDLVVGANKYKPYVGVGFNYSSSKTASGDATDSKGVCVTYTSDIDIILELGLGSVDSKIGYANPFVTLPASARATSADFSWSEFEQPDWYDGTPAYSGAKAAGILVSLKFKFSGDTDGEDGGSGSFNIMKVGAMGQCD